MSGIVYLVGAGPGDPGLLTRRAAELLARADVVVHDALVGPEVLGLASRAERVYVGKRGGTHSLPQEEINRLLVELAGRHEVVVRLKGGDPFVFGRGGEEALTLREAGVPFEVVPGVTAGIAAPAYAGIPVTHRHLASTVTFATGHEDPSKGDTDVDWDTLARGAGTVVFYMGVSRMAHNFRRLIEAGRPADTPAAAIEWGTYPRQRTVVGTLATLPALAREARLGAPALVVVGPVVRLREELAWFDRRPLAGRRVVVTRARAQASELARRLEAMGAEVIEFPAIRVAPPEDPAPLRAAAAAAGTFDWIVLTSANGVDAFFGALADAGRDARALARAKVCAVGPATAEALRARGILPDLVPPTFLGEAAARALVDAGEAAGRRILLPRADIARRELPDALAAAGAEVVDVPAYRTVADGEGADALRARLDAGEVDWITFTAASTVRHFVERVGAPAGARLASIGPQTSAAAREHGLAVDVEADPHTIPALVDAVARAASGA